jgi:DNA-binding response OmpR family regulator
MEPANVLVIEDDYIVGRTIQRSLPAEQFKVTVAKSGMEGLALARQSMPDLVILDVIMPGMDGYAVCREMRADPMLTRIPILFLTAKIKTEDKITGFNAGADDYLSKPFNIDELILRVGAILKRTRVLRRERNQTEAPAAWVEPALAGSATARPAPVETDDRHRLMLGEYMLDTRSYELHAPQKGKIRLTPVQYDLLYHLMTHPGEIFSPARLLDEVWDYPSGRGSPDLVRVHIKALRERIEPDPKSPRFIRTVPGYGYTIGDSGAQRIG